jgi:hypothetical protein
MTKAEARKKPHAKGQAYKAADDAVAKVTNPLGQDRCTSRAKKAKEEADKKEQKPIAEADKRADGLVECGPQERRRPDRESRSDQHDGEVVSCADQMTCY